MVERILTGTRARNRRLDRGLAQAEVARRIGISGSYLNLIEHNRRRIGGKLLQDLAEVLEIDPGLLEDSPDASIMAPLAEAAAAMPGAEVEAARADDLVARFPGWAALIAAQHRRIEQLRSSVDSLSNRLAHDTQIASSLHEVISTATAIRSTAQILVDSPDLDADWRGRFHGNIDGDAGRLAQSSQALLGVLDVSADTEEGGSAVERAEALLVRGEGPGEDEAVAAVLAGWSAARAAEAARLPAETFEPAARALAFDPARLAARFEVPLDLVLRRLAHLDDAADVPPMGLACCDGAGVLTYQKPVLDFRLPRAGTACPLWPLYQALTQPGRALRRVVRLPGAAHTAFECFAIAGPLGPLTFGEEPRIGATMLVRPARGGEAPGPVGPGCRVCAVEDCASRRQPSMLSQAPI